MCRRRHPSFRRTRPGRAADKEPRPAPRGRPIAALPACLRRAGPEAPPGRPCRPIAGRWRARARIRDAAPLRFRVQRFRILRSSGCGSCRFAPAPATAHPAGAGRWRRAAAGRLGSCFVFNGPTRRPRARGCFHGESTPMAVGPSHGLGQEALLRSLANHGRAFQRRARPGGGPRVAAARERSAAARRSSRFRAAHDSGWMVAHQWGQSAWKGSAPSIARAESSHGGGGSSGAGPASRVAVAAMAGVEDGTWRLVLARR